MRAPAQRKNVKGEATKKERRKERRKEGRNGKHSGQQEEEEEEEEQNRSFNPLARWVDGGGGRARAAEGEGGAAAINPGSNRKSETDLRTTVAVSVESLPPGYATHELAAGSNSATPSLPPSYPSYDRQSRTRRRLDSHDINGIPVESLTV